ncbi:MAG: cytochrome c4, partial [Thiotrichales bacterium]|nr:cytochrome c4 [Thiotrichales bacterium]
MKKIVIILASILITSLSNPILAVGDAEAGQAKSATCMGCHGLAGNSTIPNFPKLAGQSE